MSTLLSDEQDDPVPADRLRRLADHVLTAEGLDVATAEVGLLFVDAGRMAGLHEQFLGRCGPTDVLSLPLEDLRPGDAPVPDGNGPPLALGDVFVCPAEVRARAAQSGVGFDEHMALMVVHGILHLLGYDHGSDVEADVMEIRERELLAGFGPAAP